MLGYIEGNYITTTGSKGKGIEIINSWGNLNIADVNRIFLNNKGVAFEAINSEGIVFSENIVMTNSTASTLNNSNGICDAKLLVVQHSD